MSTAQQVIEYYDAKVPFPITPEKIEAAGYDVTQYVRGLIRDLSNTEGWRDPRVQDLLRKAHLMERASKQT